MRANSVAKVVAGCWNIEVFLVHWVHGGAAMSSLPPAKKPSIARGLTSCSGLCEDRGEGFAAKYRR